MISSLLRGFGYKSQAVDLTAQNLVDSTYETYLWGNNAKNKTSTLHAYAKMMLIEKNPICTNFYKY